MEKAVNEKNVVRAKKSKRRLKSYIFPTIMLGYPILQILVFYVGVNINSVLLAFKEYDGAGEYKLVFLENFKRLFQEFSLDRTFFYGVKNAVAVLCISVFIITPLAALFSYYVYKKWLGSGLFKVLLVLPMITSSMVMVLAYKGFVDIYLPKFLFKEFKLEIPNLVSNTDTQFAAVAVFMVISGFGTSALLYLGAMSGINPEILEAGKIDGVTPVSEFFFLVFPSIYGTFETLVVMSVAGVFTNQFYLFNFFGGGGGVAPINMTIGYYFFVQTKETTLAGYPRLAAMGLLFTAVVAPLTLIVRYVMDKFDPQADKNAGGKRSESNA